MLKNILAVIVFVGGITTTAHAQFEIQAMGSYGSAMSMFGGGSTPTTGQLDLTSAGGGMDATTIALGSEVYYQLNEQLQVGGLLGFMNVSGDLVDISSFALGALARYNLSTDLASAIFVQGGIRYMKIDAGADVDNIALLVGVGKRFAISEKVSWTPNATLVLNVAGDIDKGSSITFNIVSLSVFYDK